MAVLLENFGEFTFHSAVVSDILYLPEADAFITTSEDHTVRLWLEDAAGHWNSTESQQLRLKPSALAWDGCRQWVSASSGFLQYYIHVEAETCCSLQVYVGLEDGTVMILTITSDFTGLRELQSFLLHEDRITAMRRALPPPCPAARRVTVFVRCDCFRHDHILDSVVTVSRDRHLCVYNSSTEETRGAQVRTVPSMPGLLPSTARTHPPTGTEPLA